MHRTLLAVLAHSDGEDCCSPWVAVSIVQKYQIDGRPQKRWMPLLLLLYCQLPPANQPRSECTSMGLISEAHTHARA